MARILILGGTTEARLLGERLAERRDLDVTLSLAGRTKQPLAQRTKVRSGGFGGATGLADYLRRESIAILIDATHPYAATMSAHAAEAARLCACPLIALRRPPWTEQPGDRWIEMADVAEAARALGATPRSVFVALGRNELAPFLQAPQHDYLFRSVDPIEPPLSLPQARYLVARGPFAEADERELLRGHGIDIVVAKNSGGTATYGKIAAARELGVEVMMLRRPALPAVETVESVDEAVRALDHALTVAAARGV
jgi:precorrin-6A/cobalt-precorrin-6A reductase